MNVNDRTQLKPRRKPLKTTKACPFCDNCYGNHRDGGDSGGHCQVFFEARDEWVTIETDQYEGSAMMNLGTAIAVHHSLGLLLAKVGVNRVIVEDDL